jgi:hypothetical protein
MNRQDNNSDLYTPLEHLYFDQNYLIDFVENHIPIDHWYLFDCQKIRWTVQESYHTKRTECTYFKRTTFFQELFALFNETINYGDVFFTRTPPPGVPPHIDRNRGAVINFPITGSFTKSPMTFYSNFDRHSKVDEYTHERKSPLTKESTPYLFNPKEIHGVENENDQQRCLLSIWWRDYDYQTVLNMINDKTLINLKANEENKYIKFLT